MIKLTILLNWWLVQQWIPGYWNSVHRQNREPDLPWWEWETWMYRNRCTRPSTLVKWTRWIKGQNFWLSQWRTQQHTSEQLDQAPQWRIYSNSYLRLINEFQQKMYIISKQFKKTTFKIKHICHSVTFLKIFSFSHFPIL